MRNNICDSTFNSRKVVTLVFFAIMLAIIGVCYYALHDEVAFKQGRWDKSVFKSLNSLIIDRAGKGDYAVFDFDKTIGKVLEWAEKDGHTLVVVTADHNTGGLTLIRGDLEKREVRVHFSTRGHNGIAVPVYAYGPHAADFVGIHENDEVGRLIGKYVK